MDKGIFGQLTSRVPAPRPGTPLWEPWKKVMGLNTRLYRLTGGRIGGRYDAAPVLILHHVGAKSGAARETPLVYLADGDDIVIVASMGGMPTNPAWVHNLRANPLVTVEIRGERRDMTARELDEDERAAMWPRLLEMWPAWEDYQARAERRIPVLRLSPR
jgi:deazaflavin-dependent oxidoreductase (nitroreductase family)